LKTKKSRELESLSVATSSMLSNRSPTSSSATPKLKELKFQDQSDFPTNIFASAAEDPLAERDLRLGITGK